MEATKTPAEVDKMIKAIQAVANAIVETVTEMGATGAPAGSLYATLMPLGIDLETFQKMMGALVARGTLRQDGHLYFAAAKKW